MHKTFKVGEEKDINAMAFSTKGKTGILGLSNMSKVKQQKRPIIKLKFNNPNDVMFMVKILSRLHKKMMRKQPNITLVKLDLSEGLKGVTKHFTELFKEKEHEEANQQ